MSANEAKRLAALAARARALGLEPWQLEAAEAIDNATLRGIVADNRHDVHQPSSIAPQGEAAPARGTGWAEPRPLAVPPGTALIDRLCGAKK